MFGYVLPLKSELKVREFEVFRSYYCGLCHEIGKKSCVSKLTLTYDMTFLGLLLSSVYNEGEESVKGFCPFKMKRVNLIKDNSFLEYAADMNIILSNRKLKDNFQDNKNVLALIASQFVNTRKLSQYSKEKLAVIDYCLDELYALEKVKCNNVDEVGHHFGNLTAEILSIKNDKQGRILSVLGYNLGKWIYTIDAFEDLEDDIKKGKYNPYIYAFEYKGNDPKAFKESITDAARFTLVRCLDEIAKAFEILDIKKNRGIIENIIYAGMRQKTENILGGMKCEKSI